MEKEIMNYDEISKLMKKIQEAMNMSKEKEENIKQKESNLREETRILVVEEGKQEIEELRKDKEEHDEMTANNVAKAYKQIRLLKENSEKEYQKNLEKTVINVSEIDKRKKETMKYKIEKAIEEGKKADELKEIVEMEEFVADELKLSKNREMKKYQDDWFEKRDQLDAWEVTAVDWSRELNCEDMLKEDTAKVVEEPTAEAEPTVPVSEEPTAEVETAVPVVEEPTAEVEPTVPVSEEPTAEAETTVPVSEEPTAEAETTVPVAGEPTLEELIESAEQDIKTKTEEAETKAEPKTTAETENGKEEEQKVENKQPVIPLKSIKVKISKEGSNYIITRKMEGATFDRIPVEGENLKLSDTKGLKEIEGNAGDKFVLRTINDALENGKLTPEEAKEEIELYSKLLTEKDVTEKENILNKMKISINYNLKGLRSSGLSKEDRKELIANAKQAKDLGIADVEAGIFTKAKWWLQDNFGNMKNMSGNLLPRKDEPKAIGSGEGEQQEETPQVEPQKAEPGKDKFGNNITKSQEEIDRDNQVANNEETVVENDNSERE